MAKPVKKPKPLKPEDSNTGNPPVRPPITGPAVNPAGKTLPAQAKAWGLRNRSTVPGVVSTTNTQGAMNTSPRTDVGAVKQALRKKLNKKAKTYGLNKGSARGIAMKTANRNKNSLHTP